jgi:hypothetical protein
MIYLERFAGKLPDLKGALALIHAGETGPSTCEELARNWMHARPTAANMEEVFQLASSDRMLVASIRQDAAAIAWKVPGERQEILAKVTALPGQQRNWTLNALASATPPDDPATLVGVLSQFTSFEHQSRAALRWLEKQGDEGKQTLIRELDSMKDNPSLRKLRVGLAE